MAIKVYVAPLAGYTDSSFRRILREMGDIYCYTEMVSAQGLCYNSRHTWEYLNFSQEDSPVGVQLFGNNPEHFRKAIQMMEERCTYDSIDLNMGCPVPKVTKNGEGSALMGNIELSKRIVSIMVETSTKPVSVKMRLGIDEDHINCLEVAKALEPLGISHIALHARTAADYYRGPARWEYLKMMAEEISIPVIGNGSIFSGKDAANMVEETGLSRIMLGRGIMGNPFLIREICHPESKESLSVELWKETFLRHLRYMIEDKGEARGVIEFRKHALNYLKGKRNGTHFKRKILDYKTYHDWEKAISPWNMDLS